MEPGDSIYRQAQFNTGLEQLQRVFPDADVNEDLILHYCAQVTVESFSILLNRTQVTEESSNTPDLPSRLTPALIAEAAIYLGKEVDKCDINYRTPLHIACQSRNRPMIELLVSKGANVNVVDGDKYRPLDYIIKVYSKTRENRGDLVDLLAKSKRLQTDYFMADLDMKPLHYAASEDEADIIEALVRNGSSMHTRDKKGDTALHIASQKKNMNACKQLILLGADKNKPNKNKKAALDGIHLSSEEAIWLKKYEDNSPAHVRYAKFNPISAIVACFPMSLRKRLFHYLRMRRKLLLSFPQIFVNPELPDLLNDRWQDRSSLREESSKSEKPSRRRTDGKKSHTAILVDDALKYLELIDRANFNRMAILYLFYIFSFIIFAVWIIPISVSYEQNELVANYFTPDLNQNNTLINYSDVVEKEDVYKFLRTLVALGLFADNSTIGGDMILVGTPLIRQIRVQPSKCLLATSEEKCFRFFTIEQEENESFGPDNEPGKYKHSSGFPVLHPSYEYYRDYHISRFVIYGTSAYGLPLPLNNDDAYALIEELEDDGWIDSPTRVVAINFGYLNNNLGFATSVEYLFEISASGRIQPTSRITAYPLTKTIDSYGANEFAYFIAVIIFGAYYHIQDLSGEFRRDWRYVISKWMVFEVICAAVFAGVCITFAYYLAECSDIRAAVLRNGAWDREVQFIDFQTGAVVFVILKSISAISCMLAFLKLFKYMRLNHKMNIVGQSLFLASGDLFAFTVIFTIIFVGYAFSGYFFFGSHAADFQNFFSALVSTFRMLAGDFDYDSMDFANPLMAPLFTITYVILIIMILVNMFIAILTEYFERAKSDSHKREVRERAKFSTDAEYDLVDQFMSIVPSIRMPIIHTSEGVEIKRKLLQGENVIMIPANYGSKQCSDLAKIMAKDKIKVLMLKCSAVDQSYVFKCLSAGNFIRFRNIRERRHVLLARCNYRDFLPESITLSSGDVLDLHWLASKGLISTFESLHDTPLDVSIYIDFWSLDILSYATHAFKSFWMRHMAFQEEITYIDHHDFRNILSARSKYFHFYDTYMRVSTTKAQVPGQDKDEVDELAAESMAEKHPFIFSRQDLKREIAIFLARKRPDALVPKSKKKKKKSKPKAEYDQILEQESRRLLKLLPASCLETFSAEELIHSYRPLMTKVDTVTDDVVSLLTEIQEPIAEYLHDLWSHMRLKDGFIYAEKTDKPNFKHNQLKPYSDLVDNEKTYDRNIIRKVIFSLYKLGFRVRRKLQKINSSGGKPLLANPEKISMDISWEGQKVSSFARLKSSLE
eukprot:TRINITY_DN3670_c0_g1_i4.p1 TRINITY_DN3670_c0_g1~~TRINITY_DN3670_c0_g1_i4.p1  ORF type:complete len:1289 (+),score=199.91 TRINITY_DN3670_c0_g1_i4:63-3929(+)